jgi:O-antigen/teichoic acid export membrane protein
VLIMAGRTGWDLTVYALSAALDIGLSFLLVPKFGIEGAAAAQAITIACSNWLRLVLVRRYVGIFPWDASYVRLIIPAAACAVAMLAAQAVIGDAKWLLQLLVMGVIGLAAYVPAVLVFGIVPSERVALTNGLAKIRGRATAG